MKKLLLVFIIFFNTWVFGQDLNQIEKKLFDLNVKRVFWSYDQSLSAHDSLDNYNAEIKDFILDFSSKHKQTLNHPFKSVNQGFDIVSSADGLFRIYSWNEFAGGTMQFYQNVFQYNIGGKVYSKLNEKRNQDSGHRFYDLNEVSVDGKKYYITSSIVIGSSAVYYYQAKVFSIKNGKLNENAKLIKTKTGLKNTLGYEVDLSSSANRNRNDGVVSMDYMELIYDKKTQTIVIPLIKADGKVTKNKIKYTFTGKYFEKM